MTPTRIEIDKVDAKPVIALLEAMGITDWQAVQSCFVSIKPPGLVDVEVTRLLRNPEGKFYQDPDAKTEPATEKRVARVIWPVNEPGS